MRSIHIQRHGLGPPLVLFHGWGFDSQIWLTILPLLSKRYTLYLVDLPGFGLSALLDWPAFKTELLAQLPSQFALAGWSMGGLYATKLAIEAPLCVTHLMNIASTPYFIQDADWPGISPELFAAFYVQLSIDSHKTLDQFLTLQLKGVSVETPKLQMLPSVPALKAGLDILQHWDLRDALRLLSQPVAYVFGGLDAITVRKTMPTMQALYPQFNYSVLKKAAHVPFLSHPQEFIRVLDDFLQE